MSLPKNRHSRRLWTGLRQSVQPAWLTPPLPPRARRRRPGISLERRTFSAPFRRLVHSTASASAEAQVIAVASPREQRRYICLARSRYRARQSGKVIVPTRRTGIGLCNRVFQSTGCELSHRKHARAVVVAQVKESRAVLALVDRVDGTLVLELAAAPASIPRALLARGAPPTSGPSISRSRAAGAASRSRHASARRRRERNTGPHLRPHPGGGDL